MAATNVVVIGAILDMLYGNSIPYRMATYGI